MNNLTDKVVIITGAGRGIGAAMAVAMAAAGAKLCVNDLNPDRAERVAREIREMGQTAVSIPADVSNKFQCSHLIDETRRQFGRIDVLINNAAIKPTSVLLKTDEFEWQRVMDVNVRGAFFMSQLVGRVMVDEAVQGTIINIGSTAGTALPMPQHVAYATSKAALAGFSASCATAYAPYNIAVHLLTPDEDEVIVSDLIDEILQLATV